MQYDLEYCPYIFQNNPVFWRLETDKIAMLTQIGAYFYLLK